MEDQKKVDERNQTLERVLEMIKEMEREIRHPSLRYKGKICDACSEDFTHNQALEELKKRLK